MSKIDLLSLSARAQGVDENGKKINAIWEALGDIWDPKTNPDGIVSMGVAENRLMHAELRSFIKKKFDLSEQAFTYGDGAWGSKRLRKAMAAFFNRHFAPAKEILPSHLTATSGVTNANEMMAWVLGDAGDGFLLGRPYYGTFIMDFNVRASVKAVTVSFGDVDPLGIAAVRNYEEKLLQAQRQGTRIRALILCHPHNPLGRCYSREVIIALMKLCQKYQIHFVSDEIYALSVWQNDEAPDAVGFTSVLSINTEGIIDPHLVHVLWGLSKDFGANGLRMGVIINQGNPEFRLTVNTLNIFGYPSSASDHIACLLLEDESFLNFYISTNRSRIANSYRIATKFLRQHGIPYAPGVNAAFFLWLDLLSVIRRKGPDLDPAAALEKLTKGMEQTKVWITDGEGFGAEKRGWFRIVFTHPEAYLLEGLRRLVDAVNSVVDEESPSVRAKL